MLVVRWMSAVALIVAIAMSTSLSAPQRAEAAPQAKMTWGIVTGTLYLNKSETLRLSVGAGAVAALGSVLPPPFDVIVLASGTLLSAKAAWAAADHKCLKIKSYGAINAYGRKDRNGRYCR